MRDEDSDAYYEALRARDARFDGLVFVGVTSTGIYCRPICPAKTPKRANCRFFAGPEAAEKAAYRPCLRCRPELAPGSAPVDDAQRISQLLVHRLAEGTPDEGASMEDVAAQFEISSRQLRRIIRKELGVSPLELIQTRRLLLAKQLLTETNMRITDIALASGFASLRRFNDAFRTRYRMPPKDLRRKAGSADAHVSHNATSQLQLTYHPPYDWVGTLDFLKTRAIAGVEDVSATHYRRTVQLGEHQGWISVTQAPEKNALLVEFTHTLAPGLPALLNRLRSLFDLNARTDLIARHLLQDPRLAPSVKQTPGLRVPGAFDRYELLLRAVLGQQVTVKSATTLAGRLAKTLGKPIETPHKALTHLAPTPQTVAKATIDAIASQGIIATRAQTLRQAAQAMLDKTLLLQPGAHPDTTLHQLLALPGIGPWTAQYIAMRALQWPDAFPKEDIAIRKTLGKVTPRVAEELSQPWRPWRSYAVMHLWRQLAPPATGKIAEGATRAQRRSF